MFIRYLAPSFLSPFGPAPPVAPSVNPDALAEAAPFFAHYLTNVSQPIRVRGYSASDATEGSWLQAAVRAIDLAVTLPANPGTLIRSLQLGALALRFDANGMPFCSTTVIAQLNIPFKCPLDIRRVESLSFVLRAYGQDMLAVRPFSAAELSVEFDPASHNLKITTISAQLMVLRMDLFQDFVASVLVSPGTQLNVVGMAAPTISTVMGNVTLPDIPTDGSVYVQVRGFHRFSWYFVALILTPTVIFPFSVNLT
jgi:hypothetical protein